MLRNRSTSGAEWLRRTGFHNGGNFNDGLEFVRGCYETFRSHHLIGQMTKLPFEIYNLTPLVSEHPAQTPILPASMIVPFDRMNGWDVLRGRTRRIHDIVENSVRSAQRQLRGAVQPLGSYSSLKYLSASDRFCFVMSFIGESIFSGTVSPLSFLSIVSIAR